LDRKEVLRVSIENASASMVHYTRIGGGVADWVKTWQVSRSVDSPAGTHQVTFTRELTLARYAATVVASTNVFTSLNHGLANGDTVHVVGDAVPAGLSSTALYWVVGVSGSTFQLSATNGGSAVDVTADGSCSVVHVQNIAPTSASSNAVDAGRDIVIECAVVAQGTADADIGAGEWEELLRGRIDRAGWPEQLTVSGRDGMGRLQDAWIEAPTTYGTGGVAQETVMQSIVTNASLPDTLDVPVSPSFTIVEHEQRIQGVAEALLYHANLIGWDLHEEWDDTAAAWQITYQEPDRSKTTPDFVIDSDDYFVVSDIGKDTDSVRNVGIMEWQAGSFVSVEDTDSIAEFGRRAFFADATGDPQITTAGKATTLITAAVSDLGQPLVAVSIEGPLYWPVQLGDLVTFTADVTHLDEDTDLAVVGFAHGGGQGGNSTRFQLRGRPSGGTLRWHRFTRPTRQAQEIQDVIPTIGADTLLPTVEVQASQSGSTGTVTLVVNDPDGLVNATSFETQTDGGDFDFTDDPTGWPGYDNTDPFGLSQNVTLNRKHNALVAWGVRYDPTGAGSVWIKGVVTLDADFTPDVEIQGVARDPADGTVTVSLKGDEDTADIRVSWTIGDGTSAPSDPTGGSAALGARSGVLDTGATAEPGEIVWVKARGETAGAVLAPTAFIAQGKFEVAGVPDGSVTSDKLADGAVIADKIVKQSQAFVSTVGFSPDGNADLGWTSGTVTTADGDAVAVTSGGAALPALPGRLFVFFVGTATLSTSSTYTDVLADSSYILLCVAWQAPSASQTATVIPAVGTMLGGVFIGENEISAASIKTVHLTAGSVTANEISVASLDAIAADIGTVTAGTLEANVIVAAESFTAGVAVFTNDIDVRGNAHVAGALTGGASMTLGLFNATAASKQTVTGSRGGNAALASLLTALATYGLVTDSTS
jgi:hypothetical protein